MKKYIKKRLTILSNPTRYSFLLKEFKNGPFRLLDVGAGNNSATKTKAVFPNCEYYGVDRTKDYNYDETDFSLMKEFYELDLNELQFNVIPDNFFDVIVMSHIIEHLMNGEQVIESLILKLKKGGFFYLEYPGFRSTKLPSMKGCLNFFDDPTHVRLYNLKEIYNIFLISGLIPLKGGTRRNWLRIILLPLLIPMRLIKHRHLLGSDFWDLFGFAEYVIARKQ
jgi:SAM-dependent methyltransferase